MIFLDEIQRALAQPGFAPMPASPNSPMMLRVPVRVALYRPGESEPFDVLDATILRALPHRGELTDRATGEPIPAKQAVFVLGAVVGVVPAPEPMPTKVARVSLESNVGKESQS